MAASTKYSVSFVIFIITSYLVSVCIARCNQGFCHEICNEEFPCNNQVIDFSAATAGSLLDCQSANSCTNITLICPHISPANIASDRYNCEIRGDGGIFESPKNWTVYAPDSFNDVTITTFNAYISGTMHCGFDYNSSCSIQYGLWNCKYSQFDSQCFRSKANEQYINCTVAGQCKTKTLSCSGIADGENEGVCNVVCSAFESCAASTINCGDRRACNVLCTGERSCIGLPTETNINCGAGALENCTVICGSSTSSASCTNISIHSGASRGNLNVNGMGAMALTDSIIYGPDYGAVNVQCNANESCQNAIFYANNSIKLSIGCNGNEGPHGACQDIQVYCPTKSQNCVISGSANDKHLDLQIFARGGWSDIDITEEYKTNSEIYMDGGSRMHCGVDNNYDVSCLIDADWFCQCPMAPTISPSQPPTTQYLSPSTSENDSDEMGDREEKGYIVGGIFVGLVVICFIGVVYWYCCVHHKAVDGQQKKEDYQTVNNEDIEMIQEKSKKGVKDEKESKQMETDDTSPQVFVI